MLTIEQLLARLDEGIEFHKNFLIDTSNSGDNCMFMKGKLAAFSAVKSWFKEEIKDEIQ